MKRILLVLPLVAALYTGILGSPSALAATKTVDIKRAAFSPATVSIVPSDVIRWRNTDTRSHQVVSETGSFASPVIPPGGAYAFRFEAAGTYRYRDALVPSSVGTIRVVGPRPDVSLATSLPQVQFGQTVTLSGQVNNRRAGEQVQLTHQPYGQLSPLVLATVLTATDGTFTYVARPKIRTVYQAIWKTATSIAITSEVAPVISFGRLNGFVTRVYAGRSMARKQVQLQRLSSFGQWVTIKRVPLDLNSRARFRAKLPLGVSRLRIAMSVNQAGVGYLGAFSREIVFRRRS